MKSRFSHAKVQAQKSDKERLAQQKHQEKNLSPKEKQRQRQQEIRTEHHEEEEE